LLNVINFHLLPLRERPEDIIPLTYLFLEKFNEMFGVHITEIAPEVKKILLAHPWPGNVRELKNVIERAVNYSTGRVLEPEALPYYLRNGQEPGGVRPHPGGPGRERSLDRESLLAALEAHGGNKSAAAKALGISRSWLYEKLRQYDLL
ncbi:MAG TPA: sigma-54-dependent Fis family transcriptional regulator, partial [Clostridia bacterium]|nr:sigma-54-dependent Fis family transcriptional regulator [Clostridia bacterium]